jgi:glycosyltransferase involved in cell wall biosynthesis
VSSIRVLHVYRTFFPDTQGGAEETIRQITVGLKSIGVEARVFVPSPDPDPKNIIVNGIEVVRTKLHFEIASCGFALTSLLEFKKQVAWADIVHYHFPWPFADLLDLIAGVNKPSVVTYHSDIVRQNGLLQIYQPLMKHFLSSASSVVATSNQYRDSSLVLKSLQRHIDVVPIGIDENSYPQPTYETATRMEQTFGSGFFFFVGMLRYYKGLHILLEACKGTDLEVVIAGGGPLEDELKQKVKIEGISNVRFAGRVTDEEKIALIDLSKAMVFPSHLRSEAFGVTLVEGLMRGKPLISAEVGTGTSYVNQHDDTGFVVQADDPVALRVAMTRLATNEEEAFGFGRAARQRYEALFTSDRMALAYQTIYKRLLDEIT